MGNIWKFPFEVGKGGGAAFVLMYLSFCFLLCLPVMITEIAIGRKTQRNPVGAFISLGFPRWRFLGFLGLISGVLILSFYNVVAAWAFGYMFEMALGNFDIGSQFGDYVKDIVKVGAFTAMFMLFTALIVAKGVSKGIERATKIMMPALIVIILLLVGYALTLPHAGAGLAFYLKPDFSEISLNVVYGALGQAFFSLSLGMGALITYGSYVDRSNNIVASAAWITLMDAGIAFIAGLMMFPFVAYLTQGSMEGVDGGPGLIFEVLPGVFESLGSLGPFIGASFFLLLSFAALTSTVSLLEVPVSYLVDEHGAKRGRAVWILAVLISILSIPSMLSNGYSAFFSSFITYLGASNPTGFLDFVNDLASNTFLPLGGCLVTVFAAYVWKKNNLKDEIAIGYPGFGSSFMAKYLDIAITLICPLILGAIFILTVLDTYFGIHVLAKAVE